ncbi:MAG: glycosyl transferase [Oscillospiraceae bacterium]|jgi:mannosyltransferase OCH1-like enzyme|nr:glycosyl transferase [Oscillospiraceae bacterium]
MIPKIIHCCWFGGGKKPKLIRRCMVSWQKYASDFDVQIWDESNSDLRSVPFVRDAYKAKNYAFVSDYIRAKALFERGGVYLDTDVELLRPLDDFLSLSAFAGFERADYVGTAVMGFSPASPIMRRYLEHYEQASYWNEDGTRYSGTNVVFLTSLLESKGLRRDGTRQDIYDMTIFPQEYFSPYDLPAGKAYLTKNSAAIHHYNGSWLTLPSRVLLRLRNARLEKARAVS